MGHLDIEATKKKFDLIDFAGRFTDLRQKGRLEWTGRCPFHCPPDDGGRDRFNVRSDRWLCRVCSDGKWRDVYALAGLLWGLETTGPGFIEIHRRLNGLELPPHRPTGPKPAPGRVDSSPPASDWQATVGRIVSQAHTWLFSDIGSQARAWLKSRGLSDDTLRAFRVGYVPTSQRIGGRWVFGGITIPHQHGPWKGGELWAVNIRLNESGRRAYKSIFQEDPPKYCKIGGSRQNLFNADSLTGQQYAVVVEGEFDAMLVYQECWDMAAVVTLGSAAGRVEDRWIASMLQIRRYLLALDNDEAGQKSLARWSELVGKRGVVATVPDDHKDVSDLFKAGGDLRAWLNQIVSNITG